MLGNGAYPTNCQINKQFFFQIWKAFFVFAFHVLSNFEIQAALDICGFAIRSFDNPWLADYI